MSNEELIEALKNLFFHNGGDVHGNVALKIQILADDIKRLTEELKKHR